jgi:hypothetical protein
MRTGHRVVGESKRPESEDWVRREVARKLGRGPDDWPFSPAWDLVARRYDNVLLVARESATVDGKEKRAYLAEKIRDTIEDHEQLEGARPGGMRTEATAGKAGPSPPLETSIPAELGPYAAKRAWAAAPGIARSAASQSIVCAFRSIVLGSVTLDQADALAFLQSDAMRRLSVEHVASIGVPAVHRSLLVREAPVANGQLRVDLWVAPPGRHVYEILEASMVEERRVLNLGGRQVDLWPNSPLFGLAWIADQLSQFYPWEWWDAAWFVLTDTVPDSLPLRVHLRTVQNREGSYRRGVVRLEVEPWVPWEDVERAYLSARHALRTKKERALEERAFHVLRWVEEQRVSGNETSLRQLQLLWNSRPDIDGSFKFPKSRPNSLADVYGRARDRLLTPEITDIG